MKTKKKKAAKKAARAKSEEMRANAKAAGEPATDDGKKKDAEDRSTLVDKKRTKLSALLLATIGIFNGAHKEEFGRPISRKELAASIKTARAMLIEKDVFKKNARPKKDYTAPTTTLGQNLTIEVIAGNDKGKTVTGIYIDWKGTNGCAKVYGSIGADKPKNHWGRPVTETADPKSTEATDAAAVAG